jgi:hypothetical protein
VKADFDLSTRESLMASGFVGETADESHLIDVIRHVAEPAMPLQADRLPEESIHLMGQWINLGAPYDKPLVEGKPTTTPGARVVTEDDRKFWAFQSLSAVPVPSVVNGSWCRTPIDRFLLAKLEAAGLAPNPHADRRTLVRRATFDLLGLPPTSQDVAPFVASDDPNAWPNLIDRLLASPHYGERWARHWMDVVRFAESFGYEQDYDRPHAYHYRDFLIRAFNDDMPYDQFVRWQLAGDELAPDNPLAWMATGFLGAGAFPTQLTEAEFESARYDELDDMVTTTGVAFLGLSIGCARCHDHKFDPIPSVDYYRMAATFASTIRSEIDLDIQEPLAGGTHSNLAKVMVSSEGLPHIKHHADDRGYPHFYPETFVLTRGDVHQKGEVATPGFLQVLTPADLSDSHWTVRRPSVDSRTSLRRAALANRMTDVGQGSGALLARVIVNRIWQHHFGTGLVSTPNDFGVSGDLPSHPELLEWLAQDLVEHGWQLKRLHHMILNSSVYMQSAAHDESRATVDRENRLRWRWAPRRLEAEVIRDSMLAVSGKLDRAMYGPGTLDLAMTRRSVYFFIKRSKLIPMMMLFDWPEHLVSIGQRSNTTIAPQALMFLNSPHVRQYAEAFAEQLPRDNPQAAVADGYQHALARQPTARESELATAFLVQQESIYREHQREEPYKSALTDLCQLWFSMNEFIYIE